LKKSTKALLKSLIPGPFRFFKLNPEIRCQYFGFLAGLSDEEMRLSPWLIQHASGVVLGVTQIVNGLENQVSPYSTRAWRV
jgi:hypothetical protein